DRVGHGHEGYLRLGPDKRNIGLFLRGRVKHLRCEVARSPSGHGLGRDEPGETKRTKIHTRRGRERAELAREMGEVAAEMLAVELVAAVHRDGDVPLFLADAP